MKNVFKSIALVAASLLALNACKNEALTPESTSESYTISFVSGSPEATKTYANLDLEKGIVKYNWSETDVDKFTVYEINGETYKPATSTTGAIIDDKMYLEANFSGSATAGAKYIALFNEGVKAEQTGDDNSYDQFSDVLISNIVESSDIENATLELQFKRENAFAIMTMTGLTEGELVSKVTIEATNEKVLAANYDVKNEDFNAEGASKITIEGYCTITDGTAKVYLSTVPVEGAVLKITAETVDNDDNPVATYERSFKEGKSISFEQGDFTLFTIPLLKKEASMDKGDYAEDVTVNEHPAIKVGTSNNPGNMTITVGAGATSLSFYAAAWKDAGNTALTITPAENVLSSVVTIKENSGITNSSPFTLAGNEDDYKVVLLLKNISAETTFTLSATRRFVVWGAAYSTGELPKYTVTVAEGIVGGTVAASPVEAEEGSEITLTATPAEGYNFSSWNVTNASTSAAITVTDNKFNMPAANVNVSATFTKKGSETTYLFADMDDFAEWGTSYSKRTTTFSDGAYVELASANHNSSTISDCPVSKGGDVIFKAPEGSTITTLKFTCVQWGTKAQTITLNTSTDGENFTATSVKSENFVLSASNLEDVVAVKFTFSSTSNQIGFESIKVVYSGAALTDVVVSGDATKKSYKAGDKFETAGLVATAKYDDGSTKDVTANATWTVNPETLTAGTTSVSVQATYKEVTSEAFTVSGLTVTEPAVLSSISVKTAPTKVNYTVGDKFDPAGLVITRHYSDGTSDDYTYAGHTADFNFSPALTTALAETDTKVTITYKEKTVDQTITVTVLTFASLADLVAADLTSGTMVKVTFENVPIKSIYVTSQGYRNGIYLDIQKGGNDIEIFYQNVPTGWAAEGKVSGTMTCPWKDYNGTWELAPERDTWDWNNLTYVAPLTPCETPEITISNTGSATITCATQGAAIYYTVGTNPSDPTSASTRYTGAVTMTEGQTIKAIAYKDGMKASAVAQARYTAGGGKEQVYKTAKFGSAATSGSSNNYTSTFTSDTDGFQVEVANGNTNNTTWALVKFGRKNYTSVGSITTKAAIDKSVTKVVIDIDAITASSVNSIKLYSGTSASTCTTEEGTFNKATGKQTVTISSPSANKFYKVVLDCASASSNGIVAVKTVEYYAVY